VANAGITINHRFVNVSDAVESKNPPDDGVGAGGLARVCGAVANMRRLNIIIAADEGGRGWGTIVAVTGNNDVGGVVVFPAAGGVAGDSATAVYPCNALLPARAWRCFVTKRRPFNISGLWNTGDRTKNYQSMTNVKIDFQ